MTINQPSLTRCGFFLCGDFVSVMLYGVLRTSTAHVSHLQNFLHYDSMCVYRTYERGTIDECTYVDDREEWYQYIFHVYFCTTWMVRMYLYLV